MNALRRLEMAHTCCETGNRFQRRARLLQAIWREEQGYPMGISPDTRPPRLVGSVLDAQWPEASLDNFLTDTIRDVVREEVLDPVRSRGKLYRPDRFFGNCLSSQPLCFNLFGELQRDLSLATAVLRDVTGPSDSVHLHEVTEIDFEYSPGRGDPKYLGDGTAFDILVRYIEPTGGSGLIGIEVKYHENMRGDEDCQGSRHGEVAELMGCFDPGRIVELRSRDLEQIWRDHLLAGVMKHVDHYHEGLSVLLRPRENVACARAVGDYRGCLTNEDTFAEWMLEDVVEALRRHTDAEWVELFRDRYLAFEKVDAELARLSADGA